MSADGLIRVIATVPAPHVRAFRAQGLHGQKALLRDVQTRVARLGGSPAYVALQDPTDDRRFAVIVGSAPTRLTDGVVQVLSYGSVAAPGNFTESENAPALDSGLAPDERATVWHALMHDTDPRHIGDGGLPAVLDPYYPASASLLRAKASLVNRPVCTTLVQCQRLLREALKDEGDAEVDAARASFERFIRTTTLPVAVWRDKARAAISALTKDPRANLYSFPFPIQALARAVVRPLGPVFIAPPKRLARALPSLPEDAFVSPSALQLALAMQKPKWSQVHGQIGAAVAGIQHGTASVARVRAQHQLDRATKAIDRRRWVEWYKHHRQLRISSL